MEIHTCNLVSVSLVNYLSYPKNCMLTISNHKQPSYKKSVAPKKAMVKKDVKSKVADNLEKAVMVG